MNFAERLAGTYLRLNGFFLMPEFTTFSTGLEKGHAHVDLIALRPQGAFEEFEGHRFPLDRALFAAVDNLLPDALNKTIGAVCEIRTNDNGNFPEQKRQEYASQMCAVPTVIPMCFDTSFDGLKYDERHKGVHIGLFHALEWIGARIIWLDNNKISKSESWNWSEPNLADLLVLNHLKPFCPNYNEMTFVFP